VKASAGMPNHRKLVTMPKNTLLPIHMREQLRKTR